MILEMPKNLSSYGPQPYYGQGLAGIEEDVVALQTKTEKMQKRVTIVSAVVVVSLAYLFIKEIGKK